MKKTIMILLLVCFVGIVFAAGTILTEPPIKDGGATIKYSAQEITALASTGKGITNPNISDLVCDGNYCKARLFQAGAIDTEISVPQKTCDYNNEIENCVNYSNTELKALRDQFITARLKEIAAVTIKRLDLNKATAVEAGKINITTK